LSGIFPRFAHEVARKSGKSLAHAFRTSIRAGAGSAGRFIGNGCEFTPKRPQRTLSTSLVHAAVLTQDRPWFSATSSGDTEKSPRRNQAGIAHGRAPK
jgi:hypothetical protein